MPNLRVIVQKATDLESKDSNGKSDPYVTIYVGSKKCQTKTVDKNLNPVWNEEFWFDAHVGVDFVAFDLFDHDTLSKDESIGSVSISKAELASLQKGVEKNYELTLTGVKRGKLFVNVMISQ